MRRPDLRQRLEDETGANLIEAALVLPLLLLVLCGLMDFSGILYTRMALQNGVAQATRFAITRAPVAGLSREAAIRSVLRQRTPRVALEDADISFTHRAPGSGAWSAGTGPPDSIERVSVRYHWKIMTPVMARFFPEDGITIRAESAMKNEKDPAE